MPLQQYHAQPMLQVRSHRMRWCGRLTLGQVIFEVATVRLYFHCSTSEVLGILTPKPCRLFFSGIAISRFRFPCPPTPAATGPGHSAVRRGPRATPRELRSAKLDHRATTYPLLLSVDARRRRPKEGGAPEPSRRVLKDPSSR